MHTCTHVVLQNTFSDYGKLKAGKCYYQKQLGKKVHHKAIS